MVDAAAAKDLDKLLHKGNLVRAVGYLARALESRSDLWRFEINTRNATLDAGATRLEGFRMVLRVRVGISATNS